MRYSMTRTHRCSAVAGSRLVGDLHGARSDGLGAAGVDLGQVGPVGQDLDHGQGGGLGHPPHQLGAGGGPGAPRVEGVEPPIGGDQVRRVHGAGQGGGELPLPLGHRPDRRVQDGVGAALGQGHHPGLRVRRRAGPALLGVFGQVRLGVGQVEHHPVDGHHPPPLAPGSRGGGLGHRNRDPPEQLGHHLLTQTRPGLGQGAGGRHRPRARPGPRVAQSVHQGPDHFLVPVGEQRQRHHEIHDHVRGQQPGTFLPPIQLDEDFVHQEPRNRGGEYPDGKMVRQTPRVPGGPCFSHGTIL